MNKTLVAAIAAVAGGIIGASVALLYAPETGERQRRKIKVVIDKGAKVGKEEIDKAVAAVREAVDKGTQLSKEQVDKLVASVKSALSKKGCCCAAEEAAEEVQAETIEVEA